ncbi:hypothetical protein K1719_045660 [Acacia pycnantha]|nr:hypothetical protein K1719_045660 [Acacia pycnantha]
MAASSWFLNLLFTITLLILLMLGNNMSSVECGQNYREALAKSLVFFQGQRSGEIPSNQKITWRFSSALSDGLLAKVDLKGGYYDAGDNVKFNFPMAFTTTMLSWASLEYANKMGPQLQEARVAIRWATDYLLKCSNSKPGILYVGVGDPNVDHKCWERPEDMDTVRTVYSVSPKNRFALKYQGSYSNSLGHAVCPFYCSYSGYKDELLWGAAWLYRATNKVYYYNLVKSWGTIDEPDIFSWDNKYAGAHVLLSRRALLNNDNNFNEYKQAAENFVCKILPKSPSTTTQYTPGSNMQYVTAITFLLTTYSKYMSATKHSFYCGNLLVTSPTIKSLAKRQIDYILGDNPMKMSYMVGYGTNFPRKIHHRGSSLPSLAAHPQAISCNEGIQQFFNSPNPNPNILVGAIVGGPNQNDEYSDVRSDYAHSEPATYINGAIVGTLAYFSGVH